MEVGIQKWFMVYGGKCETYTKQKQGLKSN